MTATLLDLPVDRLHLGLDFRLDDDPESLAELAASIAEIGILQPLVVRPSGGGWEVVAGRRRLAAARIAELAEVPCLVRDLTDDQAADIALVENTHRRDLSPVEEGLAFARLRDQGLTQMQIAARVGRSQATVSSLLRVLELPAGLTGKIHRREMSYRTALDRYGRTRFRSTGQIDHGDTHTHGEISGDTADLISYWRRRHERLAAGVQRAARAQANGTTLSGLRVMLEELIKLDAKPLPERSAA